MGYVYLEDGTFVKAKIIKNGYGEVYEKYPISKTKEFRRYKKEARENKTGLWRDIAGFGN